MQHGFGMVTFYGVQVRECGIDLAYDRIDSKGVYKGKVPVGSPENLFQPGIYGFLPWCWLTITKKEPYFAQNIS
ncbi:MAG: hypothetical protein RR954_08245, partial [Christensenellaceae bacterium]